MLDPATFQIRQILIPNIHISPSVAVNKYRRFCVCIIFRKQQHLNTIKQIFIKTQFTVCGPIHILHMFRLGTSSSVRITFYRHVILCYVDYDGWSFIGVWKFRDKVTIKWYLYFWALGLLSPMDSEKADELQLLHMFAKELGIYQVEEIQQDATVCRYLFTAKLLYLLQPLVQIILSGKQACLLPRQYDLYQRLQLQFYVLLMMGALDTRNILSNLAVNKYLHTVASCWISSTQNYDARKYKFKKMGINYFFIVYFVMTLTYFLQCIHGIANFISSLNYFNLCRSY